MKDPNPSETRLLRVLSAFLALPGLCRAAACRRARACHGEPRDCLARYAPLVPETARAGAKAVIAAQRDALAFDDLIDEAGEEVLALTAWRDAVAAACGRPPSG
jgi:hypothetical protein